MSARTRYLSHGPDPLGDVELLALLVARGTPQRSALEIAAGLLDRHDGLEGLAHTDPSELVAHGGVGAACAVRLHVALELGRRSLRAPDDAIRITTPDDAADAMVPRFRGLPHEELHALYLDRRNRPVATRRLTRGSAQFTVVDPQQIYRPAVQLGASAVLLAHNHPSGDPTPSAQDHEVTRRVRRAGEVLGIRLLDHLVVAGERWQRVDPTW